MSPRPKIPVETPAHPVPTLALKGSSCAAALDISLSTFNTLVDEGKMPGPIPIPGHTGLILYDWESVRNAWRAIVEGAGGGNRNPFD